MELSQQVVSLELAKKLKELGVKQESVFYWIIDVLGTRYDLPTGSNSYWSAFTVGELGSMLPGLVTIEDEIFFITMDCDKHVYYEDIDRTEEICASEDHDNEANARARMIIYLIENGWMEVYKG